MKSYLHLIWHNPFMPKYPSEYTGGGVKFHWFFNFQNTSDRAWSEIRMKIQAENFFGILISTRLVRPINQAFWILTYFTLGHSNALSFRLVLCDKRGLLWPWSYGSWIYNYLCNRCLSPLMLWFQIPLWARYTTITLCNKVSQWLKLATGQWFSPGTPVSSTKKTDSHDITEILK